MNDRFHTPRPAIKGAADGCHASFDGISTQAKETKFREIQAKKIHCCTPSQHGACDLDRLVTPSDQDDALPRDEDIPILGEFPRHVRVPSA